MHKNSIKMKKIIGIIGVVVFALTMFINTTEENSTDLVDQIAISVAFANQDPPDEDADLCSDEPDGYCVIYLQGHYHTFNDCEPDTWYTLADCF